MEKEAPFLPSPGKCPYLPLEFHDGGKSMCPDEVADWEIYTVPRL